MLSNQTPTMKLLPDWFLAVSKFRRSYTASNKGLTILELLIIIFMIGVAVNLAIMVIHGITGLGVKSILVKMLHDVDKIELEWDYLLFERGDSLEDRLAVFELLPATFSVKSEYFVYTKEEGPGASHAILVRTKKEVFPDSDSRNLCRRIFYYNGEKAWSFYDHPWTEYLKKLLPKK